jgi:DNA-binding CsgD family transcriptional regulator
MNAPQNEGGQMNRAQELLEVVDQVYAAALDPRRWPGVLQRVAKMYDGTGTIFFGQPDALTRFAYLGGIDESALTSYLNYYQAIDIRLPPVLHLKPGQVASDEMLLPKQRYFESEVYNDFFRKWGADHVLAALVRKDVVLAIQRSADAGPFSRRQADEYAILIPHFARAADLEGRITAVRSGGLKAVTELLPYGVVFLDRAGKAVSLNCAAQRIIDENDGFSLDRSGRPIASSAKDTQRLRVLISSAQSAGRVPDAPGGTLGLCRPSMKSPYTVLVYPTDPMEQHAVLFIGSADLQCRVAGKRLEELYGFTRAEAVVAAKLAEGNSPADVAALLDLAESTIRTHLKVIFQKAGVSRQADLVRIILTGPPPFAPGGPDKPAV